MRTLIAFAVLASSLTGVAVADGYGTQSSANKPTIAIGGGVLFRPEYSGSEDYETMPIPVISVKKEITPGNTAYISGLQAGVDHAVDDRLSIGAVANYRFEREASDSARLTGMGDIDGAIEMGPKVRYQFTPQVGVEGTALFDVSDAHDGYTARVGADYIVPLGEVTYLTADAGLNYGSEDFNNTYYGVTAAQARAGRPAYLPDSGFTNVDVSVGLRHSLTRNWSISGKVGADYLLGDVADSPLVEEELQPAAMLGLSYVF